MVGLKVLVAGETVGNTRGYLVDKTVGAAVDVTESWVGVTDGFTV